MMYDIQALLLFGFGVFIGVFAAMVVSGYVGEVKS